jgi:hypothetical protein
MSDPSQMGMSQQLAAAGVIGGSNADAFAGAGGGGAPPLAGAPVPGVAAPLEHMLGGGQGMFMGFNNQGIHEKMIPSMFSGTSFGASSLVDQIVAILKGNPTTNGAMPIEAIPVEGLPVEAAQQVASAVGSIQSEIAMQMEDTSRIEAPRIAAAEQSGGIGIG